MCRKCSGVTDSTEVNEKVKLDGDLIQKVVKFSYHEDVLSSRGEVQEAVTARIRCGMKKLKDIVSALHKRVKSFKVSMYKSYISAFCYGPKC